MREPVTFTCERLHIGFECLLLCHDICMDMRGNKKESSHISCCSALQCVPVRGGTLYASSAPV